MQILANSHEQCVQWARSRGVKLNGVAPATIPDRGIGIVATRRIEVEICINTCY